VHGSFENPQCRSKSMVWKSLVETKYFGNFRVAPFKDHRGSTALIVFGKLDMTARMN
jgi:hypothetical protein